MSIADWQVLLSLVLNSLLLIAAIKILKRNRIIAFAILFYFITLSIVSNVVFPVGTNMSERFLFMPSTGFAIAAGYLLYMLMIQNRKAAISVAGVVLIFFSIKTVARNQVWKDDFTLFTTDVKVSRNSAKALNAAGGSLIDAAKNEENPVKKSKMLNDAKSYLERAIEIHPHYLNAMLLLGNADYFLENYEQALATYSKLLELSPGNENAMSNLPLFYREAGRHYGEKLNDLPKSLEYLAESYRLNPNDYETVRLSGIAHAIAGKFNEALFFFEKSIEMEPANAGAYLNLGNLYHNNGNPEKGKFYHDKAKELDPDIFSNSAQ
jgi:tetratricopeptide (TPR) repeat protein